MNCITLEQVLIYHNKIINRTGGKKGVKDIGLVDSAIYRAFATFEGNNYILKI